MTMYKLKCCCKCSVSMVLLVLLSICCQISLSNSVPVLDPSQIELLIDPLREAETSGIELESKKVVAKSVFNTPIRTPPPVICPPGHHTTTPGGPCIQSLVFVQNDPELIAELTRKFYRDPSHNKKKPTRHRHRGSTHRTPTETVPSTTDSEWTSTASPSMSGEGGTHPTETTTIRTTASTSVVESPGKLTESGVVDVDTIVMPMGSASIHDHLHQSESEPEPEPAQQSPHQPQHLQHHQQNTGMNDMMGTTIMPFIIDNPGNDFIHNSDEGNRGTMDPFHIIFDELIFPFNSAMMSDKESKIATTVSGETVEDFTPTPEPEPEEIKPEALFPNSNGNNGFPPTVTPEQLTPESSLSIKSESQGSIITFNDDGSVISSNSNDTDTTKYHDDTESQEFDPPLPPLDTVPRTTTPMSLTISNHKRHADILPSMISSEQPEPDNENKLDSNHVQQHSVNLTQVEIQNYLKENQENYIKNVSSIVHTLNETEESKPSVQNNTVNPLEIIPGLNDEEKLPNVETMTNQIQPTLSAEVDQNQNMTEKDGLPTNDQTMVSTASEKKPGEAVSTSASVSTEEPIFVKIQERTTIMSPLSMPMDELEAVEEFTTTVYVRRRPQALIFPSDAKLIDQRLHRQSHLDLEPLEPVTESFRTRPEREPVSLLLPEAADERMNVEFIPSPSDIYKATMPPTIFYDPGHPNPNTGLPFKFNNNDHNPIHFLFPNIRRMEENGRSSHQQHSPPPEFQQNTRPSTSILFLHV